MKNDEEQNKEDELFVISSKTKEILLKNQVIGNKSENSKLKEMGCNCLYRLTNSDDNHHHCGTSSTLFKCNTPCIPSNLKDFNDNDIGNSLFCCNYVIGMNENFIRIDKQLTPVHRDERIEGSLLINSTRIESGHSILCQDNYGTNILEFAECAGEIRLLKTNGRNNSCEEGDDTFEIVSINLQSSFFAFPDDRFLRAWSRFNIDGMALYKSNYWEMKGRSERSKYLVLNTNN